MKIPAIKKSIPSTCSLQAPQWPLFESVREACSYKSASLRYLWPTWGKIYASWILESIYQALTEGLGAAGGGEVKAGRGGPWMEEGMEGGSLSSKSEERFPMVGECKMRERKTLNISLTHRNPEWGIS